MTIMVLFFFAQGSQMFKVIRSWASKGFFGKEYRTQLTSTNLLFSALGPSFASQTSSDFWDLPPKKPTNNREAFYPSSCNSDLSEAVKTFLDKKKPLDSQAWAIETLVERRGRFAGKKFCGVFGG